MEKINKSNKVPTRYHFLLEHNTCQDHLNTPARMCAQTQFFFRNNIVKSIGFWNKGSWHNNNKKFDLLRHYGYLNFPWPYYGTMFNSIYHIKINYRS